MHITEHQFSGNRVTYYHDASIGQLEQLVPKEQTIIITDTNVRKSLAGQLNGWKTIVIEAGEAHKQQSTIDHIVAELINLEADRKTWIVGIGGGVVTDIAGYAAGIYMRGLQFGFVPTTVLGMVDASIGGKNGVDVGLYKNLAGLIRQPAFLLFDYSLLITLPHTEWVNGFAEIIKHAAIKDVELFTELEAASVDHYKNDATALSALIERNVTIKTGVVLRDEFEQGERRQLNFGHTFGHAIENLYSLPHGHAISIGMNMAAVLSEQINGFPSEMKQRLQQLLMKYELPVSYPYEKDDLLDLLKMDKKKEKDSIHFILLNKIGEATVQPIPVDQLQQLLNKYL